jgi:hypothetical protein
MSPLTFVRQNWERVGAAVSILAGAITLIFGYNGINNAHLVRDQLPWIVCGGLTGIFLLGLGGLLWVSADLRDEWRELWLIRDALVKLAAGQPTASLGTWSEDTETVPAGSRRRSRSDSPT